MKLVGRRSLLTAIFVCLSALPLGAAQGDRVFPQHFQANATGRSDINAYLLCYLSNLMYPDRLAQEQGITGTGHEEQLHTDASFFEGQFKAATEHLFADGSQFKFIAGTGPLLQDPEAMVISSTEAIYVVFRGTDKVAGAQTEIGTGLEWITTNAYVIHVPPDVSGLNGKVHKGFWDALSIPADRAGPKYRDRLLDTIDLFRGTTTKPVWITGHSLGGAHVQLFAMYMKAKYVRPKGIYTFASPHVGDQPFADQVNSVFSGGRFQRFEFVDDPVPQLPPGYARPGTRVYYNDIHTINYGAPERTLLTTTRGSISDFCHHSSTWYLRASYNQLNATERSWVPGPMDPPTADGVVCNPLAVARGMNSPEAVAGEIFEAGREAVVQAVDAINYSTEQVLANALSANIEGSYTIQCAKGKKYLDVNSSCWGSDRCKVQLWDMGRSVSNNVFELKKDGLLGYRIRNRKSNTSRFAFLQPDPEKNALKPGDAGIQMGIPPKATDPFGNNYYVYGDYQTWQFWKVPGYADHYVIRNAVFPFKVLEADAAHTSQNGCALREMPFQSNKANQVWILRKR